MRQMGGSGKPKTSDSSGHEEIAALNEAMGIKKIADERARAALADITYHQCLVWWRQLLG
jgi:hypothetical protein